jgi:hypothetical protein
LLRIKSNKNKNFAGSNPEASGHIASGCLNYDFFNLMKIMINHRLSFNHFNHSSEQFPRSADGPEPSGLEPVLELLMTNVR